MSVHANASVYFFLPRWPFIQESRILKSITINGFPLMCVFKSVEHLFMKLNDPDTGGHMFRIVISSWITVPLIRMKCLSLSLLISFSLKTI